MTDSPACAETSRTEYVLGWDGTETLAAFGRSDAGEMELLDVKVSPGRLQPRPAGFESCRVYWGSHGCDLERGHTGDCDCGCCECGEHHPHPDWPDTDVICVSTAPFYGPETRFYGEDAEARGLPGMDS